MSLPSYIKDTMDFIEHMNICENVKLPDHPILLVTMDVESLYTNVPFQRGLDAITFFLDQRPCQVPGTACMTWQNWCFQMNMFLFLDFYIRYIVSRGLNEDLEMHPLL